MKRLRGVTTGCAKTQLGTPRLLFDEPIFRNSDRGGERTLPARRLGTQPALVVALAERHAPRAQDVVGGDGVEMEVGQRKRENEGLRREGEPPRADLKVQVLARPAVNLVGGKRL